MVSTRPAISRLHASQQCLMSHLTQWAILETTSFDLSEMTPICHLFIKLMYKGWSKELHVTLPNVVGWS